MRTNARMNRFERCNEPKPARTHLHEQHRPIYATAHICTYLLPMSVYSVVTTCTRGCVSMSYLLRFARRSLRCASARSLFAITRTTELKAMSL